MTANTSIPFAGGVSRKTGSRPRVGSAQDADAILTRLLHTATRMTRHLSGTLPGRDTAANAMDEPTRNPPATSLPMLRPRIDIPVVVKTAAQISQASLFRSGQHCARQDRWTDFARILDAADRARRHTQAGLAETDILLDGGLSDILSHAEKCISQNAISEAVAISAGLQDGIGAANKPPALRLLHAQMQLRIAGMLDRHAMDHPHAPNIPDIESGRDALLHSTLGIADDMDPVLHNSAAIAKLQCDVIEFRKDRRAAALSAYQDLIDLDPENSNALASMGRDLLPDRFGDLRILDATARNMGDDLSDIWGRGGYVWTYLNAISADPRAAQQLDADLFIQGLEDILDRRADQHVTNRLVAALGVSATAYGPDIGLSEDIRMCLRNVVSHHLKEIHPAAWADAIAYSDRQPMNNLSDTAGESRAKSVLAHIFSDDITDGNRILFTGDGLIIRREM